MLDKTTFKLATEFPVEGFGEADVIRWGDVGLSKSQTKKGRLVYRGYLETLRLTLYETGLFIENSLSTLIYGHNMNDLTLSRLKESIDKICNVLKCKPTDLLVSGFEFGFTINTENPVSGIIQRLLSQWGIAGKFEIRGKKHTSVKFYHEDFNFKCYDKGFVECIEGDIKPTGNWLRVEQDFKRKKHYPANIITASDLLKTENIDLVFKEFIGQWRKIRKVPVFDHSKHTQQEVFEFYARQNPLYKDDRLLYVNQSSVTKEIYRYNKQLKEIADYSIYERIEAQLISTYDDLKANKEVINYPPLLLVGNYGQIDNG